MDAIDADYYGGVEETFEWEEDEYDMDDMDDIDNEDFNELYN